MSDTRFWVPHEAEVYVVGTKKSDNVYATANGEVTVPAGKNVDEITDEEVLNGVADCCTLAQITEASILHTTRTRFARGEIYTNVSTVLIAVNPFETQQIYSGEYIDLYKKAKDPLAHPPHVYQIGGYAFADLNENQKSQAICISGESGAGKTETTKLMLLFASEMLANDGEGGGLEDMVVQMNPILEAFGNAKTVRNNNSSRFGKWIEIQVDAAQRQLLGATIVEYLLEVTRVIGQGPGERNYHIFHQLVNDPGMCKLLKLDGMDKSPYLVANPVAIPEIDDVEELKTLRSAFVTLNYGTEEVEDVFKIVAGILHIGALDFVKGESEAKISTTDNLATAAELFAVDGEALSKCVCFKKIKVGADTMESPLDIDKAQHSRDSIAKLTYSRLFKWLVARCNQSLGENLNVDESSATKCFLGVLDIAGFESFQKNQLEQLLINLSNEKIHQFFISLVFKTELSEYAAEGVPITDIKFEDNADVLALIEAKDGLLATLDDCTTGVKQTDATFTTRAINEKKAHKRFIAPKFAKDLSFSINHYAGTVTYTTVGFLEKNFSSEPPEVLELLASSKLGVMRELVEEQVSAEPAKKGAKKATVGGLYRKGLAQLIEKLSSAQCHFIRCIKPNKAKLPRQFEAPMVSEQLKIGGVMETIAIRKAGFLVRDRFEEFLSRYYILYPQTDRAAVASALKDKNAKDDMRKAAEGMITALRPPEGQLSLGKTKVFIKAEFYKELEQRRRDAYEKLVPKIQAAARGLLTRAHMVEVKEVDRELRKFMSEAGHAVGAGDFSAKKIDRATVHGDFLTKFDLCVMRAMNLRMPLPYMMEATKVRDHVAAAAELSRKLKGMSDSVEMADMQAALAQAKNYKIEGALVDVVLARVEKIKEQTPVRRALQTAVEQAVGTDSLQEIEAALEQAKKLGLDQPEAWLLQPSGPEAVAAAVTKAEELREELRRIAELKAARLKAAEESAKSTDIEAIKTVLGEATESGLLGEPVVERLASRLQGLEIQVPLLKSLKQAESIDDIEALEGLVAKIKAANLETESDWILGEGHSTAEATKTRLDALKTKAKEREDERNEINSRIADLSETSRDVGAMESLIELTKRSSIAEFDIEALVERCSKVKAQTQIQLSLKNCEVLEDVAQVKQAIEAAEAAGLSSAESWLLPDGHVLFLRAKKRGETLGEILAAKARIAEAAAKCDLAEMEAAMKAASELGVQQSEYITAHKLFLQLNKPEAVKLMLDEKQDLSETARDNLKRRLSELRPADAVDGRRRSRILSIAGVKALLEKVKDSCDLLEIQGALAQAEREVEPEDGAKEIIEQLQQRCETLKNQQQMQKALSSCVAFDNVSDIMKVLGEADGASLNDSSKWLVKGGEQAYADAKARASVLRGRVAESDKDASQLRDAAKEMLSSLDTSAILVMVGKAKSRGFENEAVFVELQARAAQLQIQTPIMKLLSNCVVLDDVETVEMALARAANAGLDDDSKWLIPSGPAKRAAAVHRLEELKTAQSDAGCPLTIEMKALMTSLDVSAMQSLLARANAGGVKKEVIVQLRKRCETIQAQMPHIRALRNCLHFDDVEQVEGVLNSLRNAGLDDSEKWLLPEGPRLYAKACVLPTYLRKVRDWQNKVDAASRIFDVKELRRAFHEAEELGLPDYSSRAANKLYVELQSPEIIEGKLKTLREIQKPSEEEMLAMTNLMAQMKVLGVSIGSRDIQNISARLTAGGSRKSVVDSGSSTTRALATQVYDDLSNFSEMRDPMTWGTRGLKKVMRNLWATVGTSEGGVAAEARARMLTFTADKISEPLTKLGDVMELEQAALKNFWNLLRCMGDRPSVFAADKVGPILKAAACKSVQLRDEVYVQLMKQLTGNPSVNSCTHGWKLLKKLVEKYTPSPELCQFLRAFLERAVKEEPSEIAEKVSTDQTEAAAKTDASEAGPRSRPPAVSFSVTKEDEEKEKLGRPSLGAGRRKSAKRKSVMAEAEQISPEAATRRKSFAQWKSASAKEVLQIFLASIDANP